MHLRYMLALLAITSGAYAAEPMPERDGPRLKFKNGPLCMCSGGLTEEDIRNAERRRRSGEQNGEPVKQQEFEFIRRGYEEEK